MDAHSLKCRKPNKKGLKPSINIPGAEVYAVVPPDLLQKFGIGSLIKVAATSEFFTEEQLKNAELLLSDNDDETISETASLLKESILLTGSPNLAPTASKKSEETNLPHASVESENASKITAKGILYLGKSDSNDESPWEFSNTVDNIVSENKLLDVSTEKDIIKSDEKISFVQPKDVKESTTRTENEVVEEKDENKNYYEIDENKRFLKEKIRNMVINKYANIREEQDNDSNDKKSPTNGSENSDSLSNIPQPNFVQPSCPKQPAKISIISEEIVDSTKLRKLKCLHSSNVTLTPVTINSVIKPKKTDDTRDIVQTDSVTVIKKDENAKMVSLPVTIDLNGETPHKFNSEDFVSQPLISKSKNADDLCTPASHDVTNGTCKKLLEQLDQHEKASTFICNEEKIMDDENFVVENKNNEINLSPIDINEHENTEKDNIHNFKNNCKEPTLTNIETLPNLNENVITAKSKLCVQGVEKPGGEQNDIEIENIPTVIKTYRTSKRLNQSVKHNINKKSTNVVVYPTHEVGTKEINAVVSYEECKYEEFCICEDFGKLNFYDSDIEYEHIHFWKGESMTVDPKLIFSLYDDEYCYPRADVDLLFSNVLTEEISDEISVNYCWNRYLCKENVNTENESSDCESLSGQRNISYDKDITKKDGKQNCEHIDDSLETKINQIKTSNSKIDNTADQRTLSCNTHEVNVNLQPRVILTKCETSPKTFSSDEVQSTSGDEKTETEESGRISNDSLGCELNLNRSETCVVDQTTDQIKRKLTNLDAPSISVDNAQNIIISENIPTTSNDSVVTSPPVKTTEHIEKPKARRGRPPKNIKKVSSMSEPSGETKSTTVDIDITTTNNLGLNTSDVCVVAETTKESKSSAAASVVSDLCQDVLNESDVSTVDKTNFVQDLLKTKSISSDASSISVGKISNQSNEIELISPPAKITEVIEKPKARRGRPRKNNKSALSVSASEPKEDSTNTTVIIDISTDNDLDLNTSNVSVVKETTGIQKTKLNNSEGSLVSLDNSHNVSILENQSVQTDKPKAKRGRPRKNPINTQTSTSDISMCGRSANVKVGEKSFTLENKKSTGKLIKRKDNILDKSLQADDIQLNDDCKTLRTSKPIIKRCYRGKSALSTTYNDGVENASNDIDQSLDKTDERSNDGSESTEEPIGGKKRRRNSHFALLSSDEENNESEVPSKVSTRRLTRNMSIQSTSARDEDIEGTSENTDNNNVQCGVCNEHIKPDDWLKHVAKVHDYLAWKEGTPPLDLDDEFEVKMHLQNILKEIEALVCNICGLKRKYVAAYLKHKKICEPSDLDESVLINDSHEESNTTLNFSKINISLKDNEEIVQCGVCNKEVKGIDWINHIGREHNYLAWAEGDTPLNINDTAEVQKYLMALGKKIGGLTCYKCGLVRKYAKFYWQHVETCEAENTSAVETGTLSRQDTGDKVQCAVCLEEVAPKEWKKHAMTKHYNVAWIVGNMSIDVKNFYAVERYLKEYKNKHNNKLICRVCSTSKVSCCGFYAHIITCGKSEEECEKFKDTCDICNKKYLCIYKSQHMTMHREAEFAKERKLKKMTVKREEPVETVDTPSETPSRRKAAQRANSVIAKYKDELSNGQKSSDTASEYSSDSDVSVKLEQYSDSDSDDTDDMSNLSEEEEEDVEKKRKRPTESSAPPITRIPFPVKNVKSYIDESYEDFCENNLTNEKLFLDWSRCEYEEVSDDQIDKYMPVLTESCKINVAYDGWSTLARFESAKKDDIVRVFVGASVQCVAWVPAPVEHDAGHNYLSVACHSGADCPRYNCHEAPHHSNLLQIWDFGDMENFKPRFVFGLAHDYGTIWAMDWCPSGARDMLDNKEDNIQTQLRLGLLAIACSNGSAYIFCMPYPSMITFKDKLFYKIKPVAELRLSSKVGHDRKHQATSLRWSYEKGHNTIMVGYSEGTVAYFDLSNDSPLLVSKEEGVKIIHPYFDERSHSSCVTGVDVFACGTGGVGGAAGAACSGSASGARVVQGAGARSTALLSTLACAGVFFLPHWPSAVLTAVNSKVNQTVNEVEWQGAGARSGRRVGGVRARAACACCGALAAAAEPLLRVLRAHPAMHDITKYVAGILQMSHIAQKRKQTNDELAMKLEPLTYDDAVKKYGIEFHLLSKKNKIEQQKASAMPMTHYPERFPLAEMTSMAFCPTARHHKKLAIATHAGVIFLINVV